MASATECNTTIVDPVYPVCKRATAAKASIAFAFFTWLSVCVSMLFTFKEWKDNNYAGIPTTANFDFVPGVTSNSGVQRPPGASYPPASGTQTYA